VKPFASSHRNPADALVWLPAETFFVRRVTLEPTAPAAAQVELGLEIAAPFALEQLYYGYLAAPDGRSALAFATHRRLFPGEGWPQAGVVLPAFAALLGEPPGVERVRLWQAPGCVIAAAWDGRSALPGLVLARAVATEDEAAVRAALLDEVTQRLGGRRPDVDEFAGPVTVKPLPSDRGWELSLAGRGTGRSLLTVLSPEALASMDVRDKAVLATRRQAHRREVILWRVLVACLIGLAAGAVLEGGLFATDRVYARWRAEQAGRAGEVSRIETAQALGARIEEMTARRLRPFEMLALVNDVRPPAVRFVRCSTAGLTTLEVEGQAADAASVGTFEAALKALPALAAVELRDVRLREGVTTFQFTATFKPEALTGEGGP